MAMKKISQREARRLRKQVYELQKHQYLRNQAWVSEYPGGVHIDTVSVGNTEYCIVNTAMKLGYAVVVKLGCNNQLMFYGVKP